MTTGTAEGQPVAPNLLEQRVSAPALDRVWPADMTCLPTGEGWLYLAAVFDLAAPEDGRLGDARPPAQRVGGSGPDIAAQRQRPRAGLVHLSDRGSQNAAGLYRDRLKGLGAVASMSRRGCHDNAPMERFCRTLKVELVPQRRWATRDEARRDLFADIEGYDDRQRLHCALGYITP